MALTKNLEKLFWNGINKLKISDNSQGEGIDKAETNKTRHFKVDEDYLRSYQHSKANRANFENYEEFYNKIYEKLGIIERTEVKYIKEKIKKEQKGSSLEKQAAAIGQQKAEYLEVVKKNMKPYHGYPANDDFSKYREDAKKHAVEEDNRTKLVNQAISFLAEDVCKQMLPEITKAPEFREIEKLALGVGNAQKAIKNIETLKQLSQDPEHVQKCWEYIKRGFVRQIEVAHQRRRKAEKRLESFEKAAKQLEGHIKPKGDEKLSVVDKGGETSNEYEEPVIYDNLRNARERADNAKNRIEQAEKQEEEVKNSVEQAKKRVGEWNKEKSIDDLQKRCENAKKETEDAKREADEAQNDMERYQDWKKAIEQAQKEILSNRVKNENNEKNVNYINEVENQIRMIREFDEKIKDLNETFKQKNEEYNNKKKEYNEIKTKHEEAQKKDDEAKKNVEQVNKFNIDITDLCDTTNDVHKCVEDLALLYTKYVGYAKSVFQMADDTATELEKNSEKSVANSLIKYEKDRFEAEIKVISEIKDKQGKEIGALEKQREIIGNCIQKIKKQDETVEHANKGGQDKIGEHASESGQDKKIENDYEVSKQLKEHLENFTAWGREIDKAIDSARSRLSETEKQLEEAKKLESQYQALTSDQTKKDLPTQVQAEQAKNLAERYYERAERSLDRVKHYEKGTKLFEEPVKEGKESPISFAKQMAEKEQAISNAYRDLACSKNELAKTDKDKSDTDNIVNEDQNKRITEIDKTIKDLLVELNQLYKNEKAAIEECEAKIEKYSESAETDEKKLEEIRKSFDDNKSKNFEGIDGILKENKSYLENKIEYNVKKAIDKLDEINKRLRGQNVDHITSSSEAHVFLDPANSGFIVINGVVMEMREIRSFKYDKEKEMTTIVWREDIPQITIFGDKKWTRRVSYFEINTNNKMITIGIPGNRYKDGERSKGIFTFKNQGFNGAIIDQVSIPQEDKKSQIQTNTEETKKEYEMGKVKSISISEHEKQKGDTEIMTSVEIKTMPSDVIEHKDSVKCYRRDMLQNMHRINLRENKYFSPNNHFSLDLGDFDFTESRMDRAKGLSFVEEWTFRMANLEQIAKMSFYLKDNMKQIGEDMIMKKREQEWNAIENLKWAIRTENPGVIASTFQLVKKVEGQGEAETYTMLKQIRHLPTDREQLERMNDSSENRVEALVQADRRNVQEAHKARFALDEGLRQHILDIHQRYPLTEDPVQLLDQFYTRSVFESSHTASEKKRNLLESIYKAYELDKTYSFQLLVDPNKGGEVKCSTPDALMLLEEYDKYANKKLSKEEEQYIKNLENFVNHGIDDNYLKNAINLKIALKTVNNGEDLNGVFTALGKLRRGDNIDHEDLEHLKKKANYSKEGLEDYLKALRQNDEYQWVSYIDKSLKDAKDINEQILGPLQTVASMQEDRLMTLELAKKTLSPGTPSDIAIKLLETSSNIAKYSLSTQTAEIKMHHSKEEGGHFEHEVDKIAKKALEDKNPEEFLKRLVPLAYQEAAKTVQHLGKLYPNLRKELEAHAPDIMERMARQMIDCGKQVLSLKHFDRQKNLMAKMMKYEIINTLATNALLLLRQFPARIGNIFMRLFTSMANVPGISK